VVEPAYGRVGEQQFPRRCQARLTTQPANGSVRGRDCTVVGRLGKPDALSVSTAVQGAEVLRCERGAEQTEYLLVFAVIVLPMIVAARLLWAVLLYYFTLESMVIDLPLF
jgi:hypothetical protein